MSIRKNNYEQRLVDRWQCHVSKTEAESFLIKLREELYGDPYRHIRGNASGIMPKLPKWAKDAFNGKLPYSNEEMQAWADDHRVPLEAVKVFGKNHHYLNEFRKMCEGFEEEDKECLRAGIYEAILEVAEYYEREPYLWCILSKCRTNQLESLGKWAAENYAE